MTDIIYLDNGATTPPDPEILDQMVRHELETFGNPTSTHGAGRAAKILLDGARERIAQTLQTRPEDITFTSGGTEAVGLGIIGLSGVSAGRIAISATEHSCVRSTAEWLQTHRGWEIDILPVDGQGRVTPDIIEAHLHPKTRIVSIMLVNNEIGTINDFASLSPAIRRIAKRARVVVDAAQGLGKVPLSMRRLDLDAVAINGHKLHGPKGIGALWCAHAIQPIFKGGGQESGRRGGTPSAVLAWAFAEATERQVAAQEHIHQLGTHLWAVVQKHFPEATLNGPPPGPDRAPNNVHVCIPGVPTEPLLNALSAAGVYVSGGSACSSGKFSHVLKAIGKAPENGAFLRLTVGRFTTLSEIDTGIQRMVDIVGDLRQVYAP